MRRCILFLWAFLLYADIVWSQTYHVVQRGETFELIAKRYNIELSELMEANPNEEACYVGIKLNIPNTGKAVDEISFLSSSELSKMEEADNYLKARRYKKAASVYSEILKNSRSAEAYYGRGISYYNRSKYKSAIKDLETAIYCSDCTDAIKKHCSELIAKAQRLRKEQHNRRSNFWGQMTGIAIGTAATAYVQSQQSTTRNSYNQPYIGSSSTGSSHLSRSNAIIAQSQANINQMMAQGNAQLQQMSQQAFVQAQQGKQHIEDVNREQLQWVLDFTEKNGRAPTDAEIDAWLYNNHPDIWELNMQARANRIEESDRRIDSSDPNNDLHRKRNPKPAPSGKECPQCHGTGRMELNTNPTQYGGMNNTYNVRCKECGKEYPKSWGHTHINCKICHGKGTI